MPIHRTSKYKRVGDRILKELASLPDNYSYQKKSLSISNILKSEFEHDVTNSVIIEILEKMEHTDMSGKSIISVIKKVIDDRECT